MNKQEIKVDFPDFLGQPCDYEKAKYAIQPIASDFLSSWKRGCSQAPSAILKASQYLEDYDIETDSQAIKKGIATLIPFICQEHPEILIEGVSVLAKKMFMDKKIPCFLGGDHSISIGVFQALQEVFPGDFSILHLGAHSDLRPSFGGTLYNHACVMKRASEITQNIVQCGIRSMSNREKESYNAEKMFFAQDILQNDLWVDDVIEELGNNVYVTLDVNVFDPSIVYTGTPEPGGLQYHHVMKLLKKVAKQKKVLGFDVVELLPSPMNHTPEFMMAKLIYGFISYIDTQKNF